MAGNCHIRLGEGCSNAKYTPCRMQRKMYQRAMHISLLASASAGMVPSPCGRSRLRDTGALPPNARTGAQVVHVTAI